MFAFLHKALIYQDGRMKCEGHHIPIKSGNLLRRMGIEQVYEAAIDPKQESAQLSASCTDEASELGGITH